MKLRITSRMRAGFAAMSVLLLAGGLVTVLYTYRMQGATTKLIARTVTSLRVAQELEVAITRLRGLGADSLVPMDSRSQTVLSDREREFQALLQRAKGTAHSPREFDALGKLERRFADFKTEIETVLRLEQSARPAGAKKLLAHATDVIGADMDQLVEDFELVNENIMYADIGQIEHSNRRVRMAMYVLGASGILLGYFLGFAISRSILNPIYELVLKVRGATGHELVEHVNVQQGTELEDLDQHVRQLIERINTTREDLEKSHRMLQRSEKLAALGRVSAGVAHEIRNPLTSIKMLIYSMREEARLDEDQKKDLAVIAGEIDRMDRFVENFLRFARPPDPKLEPIDLNEVVHETLDLLAPRLRQARTRLVENYQADLGAIRADADQIKQVIMNLVLNALEAMPDGGTLTLETRREAPAQAEAAGAVQVRVKDTGDGIPEEMLDTLFDPFVSGREDGVGLGLAISHRIVQQHGGWMDAASDASGTTVIIGLPDPRGQDHAHRAGGGRRGQRPLLIQKNPA
jgi:signal transduction histidine kinase